MKKNGKGRAGKGGGAELLHGRGEEKGWERGRRKKIKRVDER